MDAPIFASIMKFYINLNVTRYNCIWLDFLVSEEKLNLLKLVQADINMAI